MNFCIFVIFCLKMTSYSANSAATSSCFVSKCRFLLFHIAITICFVVNLFRFTPSFLHRAEFFRLLSHACSFARLRFYVNQTVSCIVIYCFLFVNVSITGFLLSFLYFVIYIFKSCLSPCSYSVSWFDCSSSVVLVTSVFLNFPQNFFPLDWAFLIRT